MNGLGRCGPYVSDGAPSRLGSKDPGGGDNSDLNLYAESSMCTPIRELDALRRVGAVVRAPPANSQGLLAAIRSVYDGATIIQEPLMEGLGPDSPEAAGRGRRLTQPS
jgi:hypothetical protein